MRTALLGAHFSRNVEHAPIEIHSQNARRICSTFIGLDIPLVVTPDKNNILHLAIAQGACECIDKILEKDPHLAHNKNAHGFLPEQIKTKLPHVLSKYEPHSTESYDRYKDERITQFKIAKLYVKHNIEFLDDAFPLLISEEHQAYLQKQRLKMSLKGIETIANKKRKM